MRRLCATLLAMAFLSAPIHADAKQYRMIGLGASSCGTWTANRVRQPNSEDTFMYEQWVLGFLSGVGFQGTESDINPLNNLTDAQGVLAWIDNYCHAHPLEDLDDASAAFVDFHPH
jgi:hypothetical protein